MNKTGQMAGFMLSKTLIIRWMINLKYVGLLSAILSVHNQKNMYTKEQCWKSIENEVRIIKHLGTKIPSGGESYRPSESQRSTLELLQYLSAAGASTMKAVLTENIKAGEDYLEFKSGVTVENFAEKVDAQLADMKEMFGKFSDEDFLKEFDYYGMRTKAEHIIEGVLKTFAAYRMQLFLYVKANGVHVTTYDVWMGIDTPPKQA